MPALASEIGGRGESPSSLRLPEGPFDEGMIPLREVEGTVEQRAYRLQGRLTTLQLYEPLAAQIAAQGYATVFSCEADACGGFDFRYGMAVLPEPQMHVDLGDYRYLLAEKPGGKEVIALLVSRTADQGFVQVSSVTPLDAKAREAIRTGAVRAPAAGSGAPSAEEATQAAPAGDFGAAFATRGAAVLEDLVFASGSGGLEPGDYPSLKALADWLIAHPDRKVTLVGHTDASGALAANVALSKKRAQSVRAALVALGASGPQIDAQGAGYLAPRADNDTPEGRAKNRRVEVMLTPAL
ncbi:OmpA family protein [Rhodobacteraceae bacterium CYK-10]|uniref:OmpA family protein n=2 Tax=Stagnihabitans tardus TaxID=2699202 RepID=A0AAE5BSY7_9RHOB|nr:OmpA family protein [Stagnihabitans tardus]